MSPTLVETWASCLEELSRRHYNDPVTIEVMGLDIGDQIQARHVPLKGISLDVKDRPQGAVSILIEDWHGAHTERLVHQPVNVQLKKSATGADEVLSVEAGDGTTTLVRFEECWVEPRDPEGAPRRSGHA